MATSASDIFSPTRMSPSFSPFSSGLPPPCVEPVQLDLDVISKYGLTSALGAQDMIPRHSPLLAHRTTKSTARTTSQKLTVPFKLSIPSRYRRFHSTPSLHSSQKYAGSDTKHPTLLPGFKIASFEHSDDNLNEDATADEFQLWDKTPTVSPSMRDRTPVATPVRPKAQAAREADFLQL